MEAAPDDLESGRKLFAGFCEFMWAAADEETLPPVGAMEIAFCGRSNVGKSSLINALTGRKALARASHTPGRTQQLNFFALGAAPPDEKLRLVDMPGYGYAAAAKDKVRSWTSLMRAYLRGRVSLVRVFVLVDGRHGLKDSDLEMCDLLDASAVSYQIVLTKQDDVRKADREARLAATTHALSKRPAAYPEVLFTSAHDAEGLAPMRGEIARLLRERGPASS